MISKNYKSSSYLGKIFSQREVKKKYHALLVGCLEKDIIEIESKITKNTLQNKMTTTDNEGKDAYTKFKLIKKFKSYSFVEVEIETGRTHQIRVHAASIGHPIAGDNKYSNDEFKNKNKEISLNRLFLHSSHLSFYYEDKYVFILDLPNDLKEVLSMLEDQMTDSNKTLDEIVSQ